MTMGYDPYTPAAATIHETIELPDDAELELSGVAAFNTALEQLADNAGYATGYATRVTEMLYATDDTDGIIYTCDPATSEDWQDTGLTITVPATAGDRILWAFSFTVDPNSVADGRLRVVTASGGGADTQASGSMRRIPASAVYTPYTITGMHQMGAGTSVVIKLQAKVSLPDEFDIYGGATVAAYAAEKNGAWT